MNNQYLDASFNYIMLHNWAGNISYRQTFFGQNTVVSISCQNSRISSLCTSEMCACICGGTHFGRTVLRDTDAVHLLHPLSSRQIRMQGRQHRK